MTNHKSFADTISKFLPVFEKLCFDIQKLKNLQKLYKIYHICPDEKIVAYCKTHPLGITVNGSIFTDKAFYPRPAFLTSKPINGELAPERIDYFDLCNYLVIQKDKKSDVFLKNTQNNYSVCSASLIGNNIPGCEIRTVLQTIQDYLCETDTSYEQKLRGIAENYFTAARMEFKTGRLSPDTRSTLKGMVFSERLGIKAIYLLAEDVYRLCDKVEYQSFIEQQTEYLTRNDKKRLMDVPEEFADNFITDLSNPNTEFPEDYISQLSERLQKESKTEENIRCGIFIYARAKQIVKARLQLNMLIQNYGRNAACIAEDFVCLYGNKQMKGIVKLMNEGSDIPKHYYSIVDALGFTPLHYAILTNNETAIKSLAASGTFHNEPAYLFDKSVRELLAYSTISFVTDTFLKNYVIMCTTPEIIQLQNDYIALKKQLKKATDMIEKIERESDKLGRKHNIDFIKEIITGNKVFTESGEKTYHEAQGYYRDSIQRLKEMRTSVSERIEEIKNAAAIKSREVAKHAAEAVRKYENSDSQLVELIMSLCKNNTRGIRFASNRSQRSAFTLENDSIVYLMLKILNAANDTAAFRMYNINGYFFMLPEFILLNLPYRTVRLTDDGIIDNAENREESEPAGYVPCYGDSWFSPQAHIANNVLKKEYRILVKQYHPDVNKNPESSKIFLQIQKEYEALLNQFK